MSQQLLRHRSGSSTQPHGAAKRLAPVAGSRQRGRCLRAQAYLQEAKAWHTLDCKHVVESQQFNREALDVVFAEAAKMELVGAATGCCLHSKHR